MGNKSNYAKYTFAFAADLQKFAEEKHIKVQSFRTSERRNKIGSYDYLEVAFVVPRPDRDVKTESPLEETNNNEDSEVNNNEI